MTARSVLHGSYGCGAEGDLEVAVAGLVLLPQKTLGRTMRQASARYLDSSNGLPGLNRFYCSTLRRWNGSVSCRYTASVRCILGLYWSVHLHS